MVTASEVIKLDAFFEGKRAWVMKEGISRGVSLISSLHHHLHHHTTSLSYIQIWV